MSKMSFIGELKRNGFSKMEPNSYADHYGFNVVFEGTEMILADKHGNRIVQSHSEDLIRSSITTQRRKIDLGWKIERKEEK